MGTLKRKRRTAADWAKLVAKWEQSGEDGRRFAAARGIAARTLSWWKWHLSKKGPLGDEAVRLVRVDVQPDLPGVVRAGDREPSWEVATERGVLRVHGAMSSAELGAVLAALSPARAGKAAL